MPPALPGFYYDAEKNKYFKIQPNHAAAHGSTGKYSKAAVKKDAEEQREQKRRKLFEEQERQTRIKRSRVLESPLGGGWGITRELGVAKLERGTVMRAWAQGLQRREVSNFRHQDAGSGPLVFDTDTGILTHAEVLRGSGGSALFSVFVYSSFFDSRGGDADDVYFRRHVVRPAYDSGRGSWVQLGPMSGGHIFDSQVSIYEMRW